MNPKKLAIIRGSYRPDGDGGAEQIINRILNGLTNAIDLEVTLITRDWQGAVGNIRVLKCPKRGLLRHSKYQNFHKDITTLLRQEHFDLVQSHERVSGCQIYRAGDGVHKEWLNTRTQLAPASQQWLWKHSPYHNAVLQSEKALFAHPNLNKVVCNSSQIKKDILKHYPDTNPDKLQVIYNGIDLDGFPHFSNTDKLKARQKLGFNQHDKLLLYVGSGFKRKGVDLLLQSLKLTDEWQLVIVGRDKKLKYYQHLAEKNGIADRVVFAGKQLNIRDWYAASDLLVHPALYDPAPNVILEAMACGRGVIASDRCGNSELITEGQNGHICQANDAEMLAALLDHCNSPAKLMALGQNARKTAEKYPLANMINSFIALYQSELTQNA